MCNQTAWCFIRSTPCVSQAWLRRASGLILKSSTAHQRREEVTSHHWAVCTSKRSKKPEGSCCLIMRFGAHWTKKYHLKGLGIRQWKEDGGIWLWGCSWLWGYSVYLQREHSENNGTTTIRGKHWSYFIFFQQKKKRSRQWRTMLEMPEQRSEDEQKTIASAATSCWNFWCQWGGYTIV